MRKRLNPWPAISDLFAALLIATFGALMLIAFVRFPSKEDSPSSKPDPNASQPPVKSTPNTSPASKDDGAERVQKEADPVDEKATMIRDEVRDSLRRHLGGTSRDCGDAVCLDVTIQFGQNAEDVLPQFRDRIADACQALKTTLEIDKPLWRPAIEIFIEGHSDQTQLQKNAAQQNPTQREKELFNWQISAKRATTVLYDFRESCGIASPNYRVLATGYADTSPLCSERTEDCQQQNRRTTFRLRPDRLYIKEHLLDKPAR